ncbi:hypothetical protein C7974DRAFT_213006 [Boeremia exigua]|uniref:uncharacterized protein n=1 Tax=Boeremia exigua TaxID=749465 RepID=UPI001E8D5933|nr:uncharacterized protein C7974DRAFT_213006 [Boeremia exigua]KAH6621914.1 hypothetical protein C7974DRAFT_213006 [Boeremia exigua]
MGIQPLSKIAELHLTMPHAVQDVEVRSSRQQGRQKSKARSLPRELLQLTAQLLDLQDLYAQSQLSQAVNQQVHIIAKAGTPIARIVSLGLGSLFVTKGQSRRLKQLAVLLAVRDHIQKEQNEPIEVYAQDPNFTRPDENLLMSLGIQILCTPSGSDLGEATSFITPDTLVYSPFLTLEAYEQLILRYGRGLQYLIGDDFDALLRKWPKRSAERKQVEGVVKTGLSKYRRKTVAGEGFWTVEDETFPMAVYTRTGLELGKLKARI